MDAVAGVASVTQLAAYGHYAAKYLLRLYRTARDALSLVKCQQEDIFVLLQIIYRLNSDNSSLDSDLLLPVLIRIIDIAKTLSNWFDEPGVLGIKWMLIKRRSQIDDALKTLKQKSDLLGLYLVERNHAILLRLETSLNKETRNILGSIENMSSNESHNFTEKPKVMNSAQTSASGASASQSGTSRSLVVRKHMDEETSNQQPQPDRELYRDEQLQHPQPQTQQYPSTTHSNNQTPQESQKTRSKLSACGNKLDRSYVAVGNYLQDYREVDIDHNNNEVKETEYIAFNGTR